MQFHVEIMGDLVRANMSWKSYITEAITLKESAAAAHKIIKEDLKAIQIHIDSSIKTMCDFVKTDLTGQQDYKHLYISKHNHHITYSKVTTTMMSKLCFIKECSNLLTPCNKASCHEIYYPFFSVMTTAKNC